MKAERRNRDAEYRMAEIHEKVRGMRLMHSFRGMLFAWFILQCVWLIFSSCWILNGARTLSPFTDWWKLAFGVGLSSGAICLGGWLLIGLPVALRYPRWGRYWSSVNVALTGTLGGLVGGAVTTLVAAGSDGRVFAVMGSASAAVGGIAAYHARLLEERMRKRLEEESTDCREEPAKGKDEFLLKR